MHFSIDRTVHTTAFDKPVVDHWLERKIAQTAAGSTEKDRSDDRPLQRRARYRLSYIPLFWMVMNDIRTHNSSFVITVIIKHNLLITYPNVVVAMSSANELVGIGFASRSQFHPNAGV